jgi:bifunctional DNA primase/polymerase-like protein
MSTPRSVSNSKLAAALAHARHGRAVLPVYWTTSGRCACGRADCHSPAKHPIPELVPRGAKQATTSRVVIRAWWTHAPLANPALATGDVSGVVVIDVDGDHGGFDSLRNLEREHGPLPQTQRVQTGSGQHVYLAYPGIHLKNTAGKLGAGLDVRCCGGYAVTVGAVHRSGKAYAWQDGCRPDQAPIAALPAWLLERLTGPAPNPRTSLQPRTQHRGYAAAALASEEQQLLNTPVGQRNTRLNLAAFRLGRFIATQALATGDVEAVLFDAAARLGIPPHEARATIASGLRAGTARS